MNFGANEVQKSIADFKLFASCEWKLVQETFADFKLFARHGQQLVMETLWDH